MTPEQQAKLAERLRTLVARAVAPIHADEGTAEYDAARREAEQAAMIVCRLLDEHKLLRPPEADAEALRARPPTWARKTADETVRGWEAEMRRAAQSAQKSAGAPRPAAAHSSKAKGEIEQPESFWALRNTAGSDIPVQGQAGTYYGCLEVAAPGRSTPGRYVRLACYGNKYDNARCLCGDYTPLGSTQAWRRDFKAAMLGHPSCVARLASMVAAKEAPHAA